jgi:hypothetical protein
MRKRLFFLATTFSLAFCVHVAGCGPGIVQLPTKKGLAYINKKKRKKEPPPAPTPGTSIAVSVKPVDFLGCPVLPLQATPEEKSMLEEKGKVKAIAYTSGCDLHEITGGDPKDLLVSETKQNASASGLLAKNVADTMVTLLEQRLSRKFSSVTVSKDTAPQPGIYSVTPSMRYVTVGNHFLVTVRLEALAPGQTPVVVEGKSLVKASSGHWGWAIPMIILHFPIGPAIALSLLGSVRIGYIRTTFIDAMDEAAEALAERLSGGPAPHSTPPPASPPPAAPPSAPHAADSALPAAVQENTQEACQDGKDNDGDGSVDCSDEDCTYFKFCVQTPTAAPVKAVPENTLQICQDGKDNDGNGLIDCEDKDCKFFKVCVAKSGGGQAEQLK